MDSMEKDGAIPDVEMELPSVRTVPISVPRYKILLVDDDQAFLSLFKSLAGQVGSGEFDVVTTSSGIKALELLDGQAFDVLVSDVQMPGMDGMELFSRVSDRFPTLPVILLTAFGSVDRAVEALKQGAYHYFQKPINDLNLFWTTIREAAAKKKVTGELEALRMDIDRVGRGGELVGGSSNWVKILQAIDRVAPLPSTVLISGETGTGKEMVARAIHSRSSRVDRPFLTVSCADFAGSLIETELFGHERGAFTGAIQKRCGIFERAHGGTLFLDEISETTLEFQGKLLRVLEGSPFFRVGGQEPIRSDFRLIAATNRDLSAEVAEGRFRRDLYYRLAVFPIHLPPLRDRRDDILLLSLHFIKKIARKLGKFPKPISGSAIIVLMQHDWPGNVRELENMIERALITSTGDEILPQDIFSNPPDLFQDVQGVNLEKMERIMIVLAMERSGSNKTQAAEYLGIARKTLGEKLVKYGLKISKTV